MTGWLWLRVTLPMRLTILLQPALGRLIDLAQQGFPPSRDRRCQFISACVSSFLSIKRRSIGAKVSTSSIGGDRFSSALHIAGSNTNAVPSAAKPSSWKQSYPLAEQPSHLLKCAVALHAPTNSADMAGAWSKSRPTSHSGPRVACQLHAIRAGDAPSPDNMARSTQVKA